MKRKKGNTDKLNTRELTKADMTDEIRNEYEALTTAQLRQECKAAGVPFSSRENAVNRLTALSSSMRVLLPNCSSRELAKAKAEYEEAQALRAQVLEAELNELSTNEQFHALMKECKYNTLIMYNRMLDSGISDQQARNLFVQHIGGVSEHCTVRLHTGQSLVDQLSTLDARTLNELAHYHGVHPSQLESKLLLDVKIQEAKARRLRPTKPEPEPTKPEPEPTKPEPEPTKPEPTKPAKQVTDKDFYIRSYQVDWDYIDIDMSHVDLREAARLYKLALENEIGMPVPVPVLIEYHEDCDLGHRWRVVGKHTYAYVAVKLAKKWGSREDTTVWGKHEPCEACGMVQCTVLNTCSVGSGLGKEQPSQSYLDAVLAMLD